MTDAVWPDGAREAVQQALWGNLSTREANEVLAALEPFVQQRVEEATKTLGLQLHEAETRNGITGGVYTELYALRAEVARLREDGERYAAVLRLCAGDVVTCYPRDDGTVTVAINLNDYFVPASDGEEIALADAPTLVALLDRGGWPAIYQWVADRRGVPNRHWRLKPPIDSAPAPSGENRSEDAGSPPAGGTAG